MFLISRNTSLDVDFLVNRKIDADGQRDLIGGTNIAPALGTSVTNSVVKIAESANATHFCPTDSLPCVVT